MFSLFFPGGMNLNSSQQQQAGSVGPLSNMSSLQNSLPTIGTSSGMASMMSGNGLNDLGKAVPGGGLGSDSPGGGGQNYSGMQQQYQGLSGLLNPGTPSSSPSLCV